MALAPGWYWAHLIEKQGLEAVMRGLGSSFPVKTRVLSREKRERSQKWSKSAKSRSLSRGPGTDLGGNRRGNKAPRVRDRHKNESWFTSNRDRQRARNKIARKARKKNRGH